MSLNIEQKKQTSIELHENYKIAGLTPEDIQSDLGLDPNQLENILNIKSISDPTAVWRLRDYMEEKITEQGKTPYPYSVLIENIYFPYKKEKKREE